MVGCNIGLTPMSLTSHYRMMIGPWFFHYLVNSTLCNEDITVIQDKVGTRNKHTFMTTKVETERLASMLTSLK